MKGIAVISPKGGVGKTTLCHLLALGAAGWRGVPTYLFHTDNREPMKVKGRPYAYIDGRDLNRFKTVIDSLLDSDGYCIIDGGGNRPEFDKFIAEIVDLVLIPVTPDTEAVDLAIETLEKLEKQGVENVYYILNMSSSNQNSRAYDFREFFSRLDRTKIIGDLRRADAVKRLRISDNDTTPFKTPPSNVNNLSRKLHDLIDDALNKETQEEELLKKSV